VAAISIARFTLSWPLTSAKSDELLQLIGLDLLAGRRHADGDGQIEARPLFLHFRRGEVDGRAAESEVEPGIAERRHDPVTRFFDGGIRQADNHNVVLYSPYARRRYVS
jgi:hypothetical protein